MVDEICQTHKTQIIKWQCVLKLFKTNTSFDLTTVTHTHTIISKMRKKVHKMLNATQTIHFVGITRTKGNRQIRNTMEVTITLG